MNNKLLILIILGLLIGNLAYADLINPEYLTKKCPAGKIEKKCSYSTKLPFGPVTITDCDQYENNPKCSYLVGQGSSYGGSKRYCCDIGFQGEVIKNFNVGKFILLLFFTLLFEIPIFLIFKFRSKKSFIVVFFANLISVLAFSFANLWLGGIIFVLFAELLIFIFEAIFISFFLSKQGIKRIIFATLLANIISAIFGTYILSLIGLI